MKKLGPRNWLQIDLPKDTWSFLSCFVLMGGSFPAFFILSEKREEGRDKCQRPSRCLLQDSMDTRGHSGVLDVVWWHGIHLCKVSPICTPEICACDHTYVKSCLNFKGRNHPIIWAPGEGEASRSLENVNKGRLLPRILLYLICLRDVRGGGIFHGSPWWEKMTPILESRCEGRGGRGPWPSSLI